MVKRSKYASLVFLACIWTVMVWWYGFGQAKQAYIEQQRAKASIVAAMIKSFVVDSSMQNCWKFERRDEWRNHIFLNRLADKVLKAAGEDPSIIRITVVEKHNFKAWELKFFFPAVYPTPSVIARSPIMDKNRGDWGWVEIEADSSWMAVSSRGSISNLLTIIFAVGIIASLRRRRGHLHLSFPK